MVPVKKPISPGSSSAGGSAKNSESWNYFTEIGAAAGKVVCLECKKDPKLAKVEFVAGGGSLWNHLERKHKAIYETTQRYKEKTKTTSEVASSAVCDSEIITEFFDLENLNLPKKPLCQAKTVPEFFAKENDGSIGAEMQEFLDNLVLNLIISSNSSFTLAENKYLVQILTYFCKSYQTKKRRFFSDNLLPKRVEQSVERLAADMENCFVAITVDCWSKNSVSLLSVTGHYVTKNFVRKNVVLAAVPLFGSHTGTYLASRIDEVLQRYRIEKCRLVAVTADGAANMRLCMSILGAGSTRLMKLWCATHRLQLVIRGTMFKTEPAAAVFSKARKISKFFRKSTDQQQRMKALQEKCKVPVRAIPGYVRTRWDSEYDLLKDLSEQHKILVHFDKTFKTNLELFTKDDLRLIVKVLGLLEQFALFTKKLSAADATLSLYIPIGKELLSLMNSIHRTDKSHEVMELLGQIICSLEDRFFDIFCDEFARMAMLLDPRWKYNVAYLKESEWLEVENSLVSFATEDSNSAIDATVAATNSESQDSVGEQPFAFDDDNDLSDHELEEQESVAAMAPPPAKKRYTDDWGIGSRPLFYAADQQHANDNTPPTNEIQFEKILRAEFFTYKSMPRQDTGGNPFEWYRVNGKSLPKLTEIARRFFCVPPSSVDSERLFSMSSMIYGNRCRGRLSAETAEMIMLLKSSMFRDEEDLIELAELLNSCGMESGDEDDEVEIIPQD